jgi:RNA polymerase sigma-70 factor (ECF subfamily)
VSALLRAWTDGDQGALARLTPIVYDELHRLAHHFLKGERAGHSLQTTALVNEAYVRLVDYKRMHWQNRAHFLAVSAQAMRRILVDRARRRNAKRGADVERVELRFFGGLSVEETADVLRVSSITVMREWKSAKAWLYRELAGPTANGQRTLEPRR